MNGVSEAVLGGDPSEELEGGERVEVEGEEGREVRMGERGD